MNKMPMSDKDLAKSEDLREKLNKLIKELHDIEHPISYAPNGAIETYYTPSDSRRAKARRLINAIEVKESYLARFIKGASYNPNSC